MSALSAYAANITSQYGEDGIIARALEVIGDTDGWCVEFGAWDGINCSNTRRLIVERGYSAILIESNRERFAELQKNYSANDRVMTFNQFVGLTETDGLDTILARTSIPRDFDVLSIDIDGNDYHVWEATKAFRPKLVLVEFNPTIPNHIEFVQAADTSVARGSSILSLVQLGQRKGYELAAVTMTNAIFVDARYFDRLGIDGNSIAALRNEDWVTYLIQYYDGTLTVSGNTRLVWHTFDLQTMVRQLPRRLRRYPDGYSNVDRKLLRVYRLWRRVRSGHVRRAR